jgi:hypothetical protein
MIARITSKVCDWRAFPNFDSTSVKCLSVKIELFWLLRDSQSGERKSCAYYAMPGQAPTMMKSREWCKEPLV